jgi:hypothetical protein
MHLTIRRFIFVLFVLIFVITAPLVVLYTAGYRLNISNRRLQQTGVLAITTFPRGSNIILNGQGLAQKTPYVAQRIMPNNHEVILQKKGYHEWSQSLRVEEGKTAYITARLFADVSPQLLNASASALALRSRESTTQITVDDASVSFYDNGANVEVRTGAGATNQLIALLPLGNYHLLEEDAEYILITDERQSAFIVARQGGEVVELPTHLTAFDWLANEDLLIWSDGTEVNTYAAETNESSFITREGQTIIDVAWHPEADSFFVASATGITAYDRSVYETREVTQILSGATIHDIWLDAGGKNLYFLEAAPLDNALEPIFVNELPLTL